MHPILNQYDPKLFQTQIATDKVKSKLFEISFHQIIKMSYQWRERFMTIDKCFNYVTPIIFIVQYTIVTILPRIHFNPFYADWNGEGHWYNGKTKTNH